MIIGFYVGDEKRDLGRLPFNILLAIVAVIMILSEVLFQHTSCNCCGDHDFVRGINVNYFPPKKIAEVFFVNMVENNPSYLPGLGYGKLFS